MRGLLVSGRWLVVFSMLLVLFLAACENAIKTVPFNGTVTSNNDSSVSCDCQAGETCENGNCACKGKTCQGKCVPANSCCTSAECGDGECVNGKCATNICKFGEEMFEGECICAKEMVRCAEQNKCIKIESCCHSGQCSRLDRCVPTLWKATVCVEAGERKSCRALADNKRTERVVLDNSELLLQPKDWWNNGNITLTINNRTLQLAKNQTIPFDAFRIYQEGIETIGGSCTEDED